MGDQRNFVQDDCTKTAMPRVLIPFRCGRRPKPTTAKKMTHISARIRRWRGRTPRIALTHPSRSDRKPGFGKKGNYRARRRMVGPPEPVGWVKPPKEHCRCMKDGWQGFASGSTAMLCRPTVTWETGARRNTVLRRYKKFSSNNPDCLRSRRWCSRLYRSGLNLQRHLGP